MKNHWLIYLQKSNTMPNEYIKKSDIAKLLWESINQPTNEYTQGRYDILCELSNLPTINLSVIEEMIDEDMNSYDKAYYPILQEALSRIHNQ